MGLLNRIRMMTFVVAAPAILFCVLGGAASAADVLQKKSMSSGNEPIVIRSASMEIDNKKKIVLFSGSVEARKEDMLIRCQKMSVHYQDKGTEKSSENKGFKIEKIVARGDVKIDRPDGGSATAEEAIYYDEEEKLVLRGNPRVKQGEDYVEGAVITVFLKEDRSVVEGGGDQKVKAFLAPRNRKR